jgi:Tn3 transposase DDE domain
MCCAAQGALTTGDDEEIMHKASALRRVSNAIWSWHTSKIPAIVAPRRAQGEAIDDATLAPIALLPCRHGGPHGRYCMADVS